MKNIIMSIYLFILSMQDIYQQKISLYLLLPAITCGGIFSLVQHRGWWVFLDILPGAALCVTALAVPKALGLGDGIVGMVYGLFYGGYRTCLCFMLAFALAAVIGVVCCIGKKRRKIQIPFVPFILVIHVVMQ